MTTYSIIRFYENRNHPDNHRVIRSGLTLAEAQAHCQDESTHGDGWFDGYTEENPRYKTGHSQCH